MRIIVLLIWHILCPVTTTSTLSTTDGFQITTTSTSDADGEIRKFTSTTEKSLTRPNHHINSHNSTHLLGSRDIISHFFNRVSPSSDNQQSFSNSIERIYNERLPEHLFTNDPLRKNLSGNITNNIHAQKLPSVLENLKKTHEGVSESQKDKQQRTTSTTPKHSDDIKYHSATNKYPDLDLMLGYTKNKLISFYEYITNMIEKQLIVVFGLGRNGEHTNYFHHKTKGVISITNDRFLAVDKISKIFKDEHRSEQNTQYHKGYQHNITRERGGGNRNEIKNTTINRELYKNIGHMEHDVLKSGIRDYHHRVRKRTRCMLICSHCERLLHQRWSSLCEVGCRTRNAAFELCSSVSAGLF